MSPVDPSGITDSDSVVDARAGMSGYEASVPTTVEDVSRETSGETTTHFEDPAPPLQQPAEEPNEGDGAAGGVV